MSVEQDLIQKIQQLKARIEELERENKELKAKAQPVPAVSKSLIKPVQKRDDEQG